LSIRTLQAVEELERYAAGSLRNCYVGLTFNSEKAKRIVKSCGVGIFRLQVKEYFGEEGFSTKWIDDIKRATLESVTLPITARQS